MAVSKQASASCWWRSARRTARRPSKPANSWSTGSRPRRRSGSSKTRRPARNGSARTTATIRPPRAGRRSDGACRHPSSALVVLDHLRRPRLGLVGIAAELAQRAALAQQVPRLVELDVDLVEARLLIVRHAVLGVELLLFGDEVRDVVKHGPVGRVLGHDVSPLSEGNQRKIGNATFAQTIRGHEGALAAAATKDNAPRRWRLRDDLLDMVDVKPPSVGESLRRLVDTSQVDDNVVRR